MVHAYALELAHLSVEEETLVRTDFYASYTEPCAYLVSKDMAVTDADHRALAAPISIDGSTGIYLCVSTI